MKRKESTVLYIVIPCYNEKEVLNQTIETITNKLTNLIDKKSVSAKSRIMFIDDGSRDESWNIIEHNYKINKLITGIKLSNNRGHQNALMAGLMTAKEYADIVISMDADLQDDIESIDEMIFKYYSGNDIVYGVRNSRKKDTFFKRGTAQMFYKLMKSMGINIIYNHADYRLASKNVLNVLSDYKEVNLFLRGLFPLIGFKYDIVNYERKKRVAGKSKYSLKKMISFAWDGITSFSIEPIRLVLSLGIIIFIISLIMIGYSLIEKIIGNTVPGWTFIVCSIWMLAGVQMLSIGLIGEYIGKIYSEVKSRPRYTIIKDLNNNN